MNIGIDVRLLARGQTSGIPEYTRELLSNFFSASDDNQYQLFYNAFSKKPLPSAWLNNPKVQIISRRIPNRALYFSTHFLKTPKIEQFLPASDLIFSPHFDILATKKPRIVTFHDLSFLQFPHFFSKKRLLWHWLQNYRQQAKDAKKIIAVSEFTKSDLVNLLGIDSEKISVIPLGVSKKFFPDSEISDACMVVRKKYALERPFLLYLGALEARKNVLAIIKAFVTISKTKQFLDYDLVLAGKPGFGSREIFREAKSSGVSERIIFLHSLADRERAPLYNLARIFIYPSFFEGFGFPPLEAQSCGTPVIAADRTSLGEVLSDSAILIDPWRVDELASAIVSLESDRAERDKIIKKGIQNAQRFNWRTTAKKTLNIFTEIANEGN